MPMASNSKRARRSASRQGGRRRRRPRGATRAAARASDARGGAERQGGRRRRRPRGATRAAAQVVGLAVAGRRSILPVPPPRPAGQRPRKKMRLPEIQQMVRSLSVENDALRQEMKALQKACTALSKENGKLEIKLDHTSGGDGIISGEKKGKPQPVQRAAELEAQNGFALPDLNLPAQEG